MRRVRMLLSEMRFDLTTLNLVLAIEEEYGFQFLPEEMDQATTVGSLARLVTAKRGA